MTFNPPLAAGEQIYKYSLIDCIGNGSHGEIWLAKDQSINRDVAVKILDSSQAALDDHIQEAHRGNIMDHDNLVKIHYADVVQRNARTTLTVLKKAMLVTVSLILLLLKRIKDRKEKPVLGHCQKRELQSVKLRKRRRTSCKKS